MGMRAVGRYHLVGRFKREANAALNAFLANREMHRAAHYLRRIASSDIYLDPPYAEHIPVKPKEDRRVRRHGGHRKKSYFRRVSMNRVKASRSTAALCPRMPTLIAPAALPIRPT